LTSTINGTTTGYTYQRIGTNPKNWQRLLNDGTTAYTCDGNGNSATIGLLTLTWDRENHLVGIGGSGMAAYSFDFGGRRVSSGGQAFVYDGENRIQDVGAPSAQYLFGPMIDEPLAASSSAGAVYYVVDALGSIGLGVDPSGNAQQSYVFDAWGVPRFQAVTAAQPFGYTGREFADAGYQFYRARQYAPILGRFLSEDPLPRLATAATQARAMKPALPRSIFYYPASRRSTYAYVENNAVTSTDPMGLAPCSAETRAACIAGCKAKGRLYLACETVFDCALFELSICYCQYKEPPKPKIGERDCYAELAKCLRFAKDPILGTEDPFKVVLCMAAFRVCMEGK
jgi:RHS repeat-associated protein